MKTTLKAYQLLHRGAVCLAEVEAAGMRVDLDYLHRAIEEVGTSITALEGEMMEDSVYRVWRKRFGSATKLGSRTQLGKVLFEDLKYPSKKTTSTGRYGAGKDALAGIDLPFVRKFVEVEELKKLRSTNLVGLKNELVGEYLHPFFHLHTTVTTRSSSSLINFQNIPNRNPKHAEIVRRCFIPRDGHVLLEIDFKGVEVSVAASVTQDPVLMDYVNDSAKDMHRDTAMQLFFLKQDEVTKAVRHLAKNGFVFPEFYGSVAFQCAPLMWEVLEGLEVNGVTLVKHLKANGVKRLGDCEPGAETAPGSFVHHVKAVEDDFWQRRFKVYTKRKREWWDDYREHGGHLLVTGFWIEGDYRRNQVINQKIQGPAFHCALRAMIETQDWLRKRKMKTVIIGTIHDSVNFDAHRDELPEVVAYFRKKVAGLAKAWKWIRCPLAVEVEVAEPTWFHKKPWEEN